MFACIYHVNQIEPVDLLHPAVVTNFTKHKLTLLSQYILEIGTEFLFCNESTCCIIS